MCVHGGFVTCFLVEKAITSPVHLGTLTGELICSVGSVATCEWDELADH